jgi:hypothetical protein
MAEEKTFGEMTIDEAIIEVQSIDKRCRLMTLKIDMLGDAFHQWRLSMEACAKAREERAKAAPLSDDYLDIWVPRMEEKAKSGSCARIPEDECSGCPCSIYGPCGSFEEDRATARAFLARPDVLAWKERQKVNEWPKWITVPTLSGFRRVLSCHSSDDWSNFSDPRLATAAEIDAVRRG